VIKIGIVAHLRGAVVDEGDVVDVGGGHSGDDQGGGIGLDVRRREARNAFLVNGRRSRVDQLRRRGVAVRRQRRR